jgi:hypothetical protein
MCGAQLLHLQGATHRGTRGVLCCGVLCSAVVCCVQLWCNVLKLSCVVLCHSNLWVLGC